MAKSKSKSTLPSIKKLLSDSIALYRSSWRLFVWLMLLPILASLAVILVTGIVAVTVLAVSQGDITPERLPWLIPPLLAALISLLIINAVGKIALIKAIELKGKTTIKKLLKIAWPLTGKYIWLQIIIAAVLVLGFILLVIPGIVFATWFAFANTVLVVEGITGTQALKQSKLYIKDKFWAVLGRISLIFLIILFISGLASDSNSPIVITVIQLFLSFIVAPITSIYLFKLYLGAKAKS